MVSLAGPRGEAVLELLAFAGPLPVNASQKVALPNGEVLNFGARSGHKHKQLNWPINGRPATEKDLADKRICWNVAEPGYTGPADNSRTSLVTT